MSEEVNQFKFGFFVLFGFTQCIGKTSYEPVYTSMRTRANLQAVGLSACLRDIFNLKHRNVVASTPGEINLKP